jgi:toxin FitB
MILLDSNIIIYSAQPKFAYLRPLIMDSENAISAFTTLEVLGYHGLQSIDKRYFESAFEILDVKTISAIILQKAIDYRQQRKISPGDAIIAATAVHYNFDLYTRNISDFNWISGIRIIDPII